MNKTQTMLVKKWSCEIKGGLWYHFCSKTILWIVSCYIFRVKIWTENIHQLHNRMYSEKTGQEIRPGMGTKEVSYRYINFFLKENMIWRNMAKC